MRILQLTLVAVIGLTAMGAGIWLVESVAPDLARPTGPLPRADLWREFEVFEIRSIPLVLGLWTAWIAIRTLRLRRVQNEIDETIRPWLFLLRALLFVFALCAALNGLLAGDWRQGLFCLGYCLLGATFRRPPQPETPCRPA